MVRITVLKRLRQLYVLEFFNVFWLPFTFWFVSFSFERSLGVNSYTAMAFNSILLLEGSYFWFSLYKQLATKSKSNFTGPLKLAKLLNAVGIVAVMAVIVTNSFVSGLDKFVTFFFTILAVLEHINYFEIQLMYDNRNDWNYLLRYRRLKTAKLKRLISDEK